MLGEREARGALEREGMVPLYEPGEHGFTGISQTETPGNARRFCCFVRAV